MATPEDHLRNDTRTRRPRLGTNRSTRMREGRRRQARRGSEPSTPEVEPENPRIVAERTVIGPYGEEEHEIVDDHGRRFWSLRPQRAARYDVYGFGWFWWLVLWLIIIGLVVWGWGGGWGY